MLAASTEMNTIVKGALTKILGCLGQALTSQRKKVGVLASCIYQFYQQVNKIKYQFFHFCTLFSHILQIYLNTFLFFIENYRKCNISMRLENFRAKN